MRIVYNRVRKPGHSIVNQASRPGRLRREGADVLPMPYQDMAHWREAAWGGWLVGADGEDDGIGVALTRGKNFQMKRRVS